jgi:hypothetical protein
MFRQGAINPRLRSKLLLIFYVSLANIYSHDLKYGSKDITFFTYVLILWIHHLQFETTADQKNINSGRKRMQAPTLVAISYAI